MHVAYRMLQGRKKEESQEEGPQVIGSNVCLHTLSRQLPLRCTELGLNGFDGL